MVRARAPDPFVYWPDRRVVARRFVECIDAAKKEALLMYGLPPIGIANADRAVKRALARGIRIRSLYPEERAVPDTMKFLEPLMKAGERVRFGRYVPTRLAIFDQECMMIALAVSDEPEFCGLEVRHPEMVALATSAFEYAWRDGWEYIQPAKRKSKSSPNL
jgi:sugar-specific transcriptional regulator TrmB